MALPENNDPKPELHIDADWKNQAQVEKEKLEEKVGDAAVKPPAMESADAPRSKPSVEPSFERIVEQFAAQAHMAMGAIPQPGGAKKMDIGLPRFFIDSLAVLEEKTKGNLTAGEQRSLLTALTDLRMTHVNV
ncbi:MAG: DUF1844 domain-containing protein [Phycisphaerae bacterium]